MNDFFPLAEGNDLGGAPELDGGRSAATPKLTTWTGRLTAAGEALAACSEAQGEPPPLAHDLLNGWAALFMEQPD